MNKLNIVLAVITLIGYSLSDRTIVINNQCQQTIWMGVLGNPEVEGGGFEVGANSKKEIQVPDKWESGRFWPRTGCRNEDDKLICATGDCDGQMQCGKKSGQPPATSAEFTLKGHMDQDYYDLSNVDGHTIGMAIKPIEGTFQKIENPENGEKYNCGTATCTFDMSQCPEELKMDDGTGGQVCASICTAIQNEQHRNKHQQLQEYFDNPDTRSLLCCSCDGDHCVSPSDSVTPGGKCEVEKWPKSSLGNGYNEVFKSQCPDAYSWQFDDPTSTYVCKQGGYEIILCP